MQTACPFLDLFEANLLVQRFRINIARLNSLIRSPVIDIGLIVWCPRERKHLKHLKQFRNVVCLKPESQVHRQDGKLRYSQAQRYLAGSTLKTF